jgi:hypothetical protein
MTNSKGKCKCSIPQLQSISFNSNLKSSAHIGLKNSRKNSSKTTLPIGIDVPARLYSEVEATPETPVWLKMGPTFWYKNSEN